MSTAGSFSCSFLEYCLNRFSKNEWLRSPLTLVDLNVSLFKCVHFILGPLKELADRFLDRDVCNFIFFDVAHIVSVFC